MGLVIFGALGLYLLISVAVVVGATGYARRHGKSAKRWGSGAALGMYLLVFWDHSTTNKSVLTLQMIEEASIDFAPGGGNTLTDNKVEQFNFAGLVTSFDQARAANPALTSWALSNALLTFYLGGSDTAAIGGDLAYQYGKTGSLSNIGFSAAQSMLGNAQFGQVNQAINQRGLSDGLVKLSA